MIKADIFEIEKLTDILISSASGYDEALQRLKMISYEMHEDVELSGYVQTVSLLDIIETAVERTNRSNETLQSLKNAMLPVANTYYETEIQHKNALSRMTIVMDTVSLEAKRSVES